VEITPPMGGTASLKLPVPSETSKVIVNGPPAAPAGDALNATGPAEEVRAAQLVLMAGVLTNPPGNAPVLMHQLYGPPLPPLTA
jgi:hypothetical protein